MKEKNNKRRATAYLVKIAILAALSSVLYLFIRIPIFPPPFNVLQFDFATIPSLLGGFALGPVAGVAIECIKVLIKFFVNPSQSAGVGELSNFIVSIAFVLPASIIYKYNKTKKGALIGLGVGVICNAIVSSLSNYFLIVPFYAKMISPYIMDVRVEFAFVYGLAFNVMKTVLTGAITYMLYKRLSGILHL
ncbi:MAG: ECF transporter S component [Christensenellaceae bacterium]|jgi:riboflavin transporter FmnP|nr:ECF transporter S component [Christensenellaceae bacterium]